MASKKKPKKTNGNGERQPGIRARLAADWIKRGLVETQDVVDFLHSKSCPQWQRDHFASINAVKRLYATEVRACFNSYEIVYKTRKGVRQAFPISTRKRNGDGTTSANHRQWKIYTGKGSMDPEDCHFALLDNLKHAVGTISNRCLPFLSSQPANLRSKVTQAHKLLSEVIDRLETEAAG